MEDVLFLGSIAMLLAGMAIPVGLIGGLAYFTNQRMKEKKVEAKKDYSKY